jgi:SAM-dependent methyltransferase
MPAQDMYNTRGYQAMDYADRVEQEINFYKDNTDIGLLPAAFAYWGAHYLRPKMQRLGYGGFQDMFVQHIARAAERIGDRIQILSIGAGNCDFEAELAVKIRNAGVNDFQFHCLDINSKMLARGREHAARADMADRFVFVQDDFNTWRPQSPIHIAIGNQSLHHVVELEHLFDGIRDALDPRGYFLINDMIGRNGHMRWPEVEYFIRALWRTLPPEKRYHRQLKKTFLEFYNHDCSAVGFEGVRAQDILPLLRERFHFAFFLGFAAIVSPFISRGYGHAFDPDDPHDRRFLDDVATLDDCLLASGIIKPTQMFAALSTAPTDAPVFLGTMTPEACTRDPSCAPTFAQKLEQIAG